MRRGKTGFDPTPSPEMLATAWVTVRKLPPLTDDALDEIALILASWRERDGRVARDG